MGDVGAAVDMFELAKTVAVNADDALQADLNRMRLYVEARMADPLATIAYPIILPDRLAVIVSSEGQPQMYRYAWVG